MAGGGAAASLGRLALSRCEAAAAKLAITDKDGAPGEDELVITVVNRPPVCSDARPSVASIWPPNRKFVAVDVLGLSDADNDDLAIEIISIRQDEPLDTVSGNTSPDGKGVGTAIAEVRAERAGSKTVLRDGRVHHLGFTAEDGHGGTCSGTVEVGVPHDQNGSPAIDGGPLFDSTQGWRQKTCTGRSREQGKRPVSCSVDVRGAASSQ